MPLASEEHVPKPLTYALMYHVVWSLLFGVSGVGLAILFLATGQSWQRSLLPPTGLVAFGMLSGFGVLALYVVRVQLMTENVEQRTAYRLSQWSNRWCSSLPQSSCYCFILRWNRWHAWC